MAFPRAPAVSRCIVSGPSPSTKMQFPAATEKELFQLLMFDAGQHRGVADLVPVKTVNGKRGPIGRGI